MPYFFVSFLVAFFLAFSTAAATPDLPPSHELKPAGTVHAQEVTRAYLEAVLLELKRLGRVPPDATIESVDWRSFGITVNVPNLPRQRTKAHKTRSDFAQQEDPCASTEMETYLNCVNGRMARFNVSIQAIGGVTSNSLCERLLAHFRERLSADYASARSGTPDEIACSPGASFSEIQLGYGDNRGFRIYVNRDQRSPPNFSVSLIGTPYVLDQMNGDHLERHDFHIYWAFDHHAWYLVEVVPVLSAYRLRRGAFSELIGLEPEDAGKREYALVSTRVIPRKLAAGIAQEVSELTQDLISNGGPELAGTFLVDGADQ
jgi:hypothetical protein